MKPPNLAAGLLLLLGVGAFWDGLYAPAQQLLVSGVLAAAVLLRREVAGPLGRAPAFSRAEMVALVVMASAGALSLIKPAAAGVAAHGPGVILGWFLAIWLGRTAGDQLARGLAWLWFWAGPLMAFGGLAAISYLPPHHSGRLASFLGYPVALGVLGMLGLAGGTAVGRGIDPALQSLLWFGNGLAILLSGSRGVWAACGALLLLLWRGGNLAGPGERVATRTRPGQIALAALAAALWAGPAVAARQPVSAWIGVASIGLTLIMAHSFQRRWLLSLADMAFAAAAALAPGWAWLLGRTALPLTEGSSVERLAFLRDGLSMMAEQPLGAGYRAWASLHLQGASYGYYSAEAHSALVDLGLAFGWAGAAAFLWLLGRLVWQAVRPRAGEGEALRAVVAGAAALGIHALVDWDLSYALFAVPLWLSFGLAGARSKSTVRLPAWAVRTLAGLALALCVLLGAGDLSIWLGERALNRAEAPAALRHGTLAAGLNPWNETAHALRGRALSALSERETALAAIGRARSLNPYEPWYAELQARELSNAGPGRWREAGTAYREFVRLWPWHLPAYEAALERLMDLTLRASLLGDERLAADLRRNGQEILEQLTRTKVREPASTPRRRLDVESPTLARLRPFFTQNP